MVSKIFEVIPKSNLTYINDLSLAVRLTHNVSLVLLGVWRRLEEVPSAYSTGGLVMYVMQYWRGGHVGTIVRKGYE
jgi:hypothetical protein